MCFPPSYCHYYYYIIIIIIIFFFYPRLLLLLRSFNARVSQSAKHQIVTVLDVTCYLFCSV